MRTSPKNILIVDDHAILRSTLSLIFTRAGYRVRCAGDGFSALAEMRGALPEVLLSDPTGQASDPRLRISHCKAIPSRNGVGRVSEV